jgi:hypothetical protein
VTRFGEISRSGQNHLQLFEIRAKFLKNNSSQILVEDGANVGHFLNIFFIQKIFLVTLLPVQAGQRSPLFICR